MEGFKNRLLAYIEGHLKISIRAFEEKCGLTNGTIGAIKIKGPSVDNVSKISDACPDLNLNWLVSGRGQMLLKGPQKPTGQIPLLPFSAAAGYLSGGNDADSFRENTVAFLDFADRGADCAIRVDGDSMYPRYKSGDILAIKILKDPSFFQWGRVYCISTSQGCIIKKLFPVPGDESKIICHSENSELYPDYTITKSDVLAVAIVVGHAGVE